MGEEKDIKEVEIIDFNTELSEGRVQTPSIKDLFNKRRGRKNDQTT